MGPSADNDPDFTNAFCGFLQRCVTNVDGAELLLALARNPGRFWHPRDLVAELAPLTNVSEADVQRHLDGFLQCGIVDRGTNQRVQYRAASSEEAHLATLARLYVERPVTLFRVIYALRDMKIKTLADAFKLRG